MFPFFSVKKASSHNTHEKRNMYDIRTLTFIWPFFCDAIWHFFLLFLLTKGCEKKFYCHTFLLTFFADLLVHEKIYRLNQYHTVARTHTKRCFFKFCLLPSLLLHLPQPQNQVCCAESIICIPHNHNQFSVSMPSIFFPSSWEKSICNLS